MPRSHFALFQKYLPGTTRRSGPPCSGVSGSPSACVASSGERILEGRERRVGRVALLGVGDREARGRLGRDELGERAPGNALERHVEAAPARDAVDVLGHFDLRQLVELLPRERRLTLDLAPDAEVPGREVGLRDGSGVEHRPLVGDVLAGRQPSRVVAGVGDLLLRP